MARLTKLKVSNFKRIEAIEFEPSGNVSIISGMNEQGKSSLLDSISILLQGKAAKIPNPVRLGAKKAQISGEISSDKWDAFDNMVITRTITATGNWYVKIESDGKKYNSPEKMLRKIFGEPVDPVEFVKISSADRVKKLKRLTGLDFNKIDEKKKKLFDERLLVGREIKKMDGHIKSLTFYPDAPEEIISQEKLLKELDECQSVNIKNNEAKKSLEDDILVYDDMVKEHKKMSENIQDMINAMDNLKAQIDYDKEDIAKQKKIVDHILDIDEYPIREKLSRMEEINDQVRSNNIIDDKKNQIKNLVKDKDTLTDLMSSLDDEKSEMLASVTFPVEGLGFGDGDVTYNGLPFSDKQLSSEELLRVSFAISIATQPALKNILIREGSLLDDNNLQLIQKMAEDANIHVFIEIVGTDNNNGIVIEGGRVLEDNEDKFAEI